MSNAFHNHTVHPELVEGYAGLTHFDRLSANEGGV
jgi:hypothetical protein